MPVLVTMEESQAEDGASETGPDSIYVQEWINVLLCFQSENIKWDVLFSQLICLEFRSDKIFSTIFVLWVVKLVNVQFHVLTTTISKWLVSGLYLSLTCIHLFMCPINI
jgi:hypothetical protein